MVSRSLSESATLQEVFREQRQRLWGFFIRGVGEPLTAEDLLQESFLRAWDHRADFATGDGGGDRDAARRYLWRVARNLMIDVIRAKARRRERGHAEVGLESEDWSAMADRNSPDPARQVELEDCVRVLHETVGRLPHDRMRRCLELWLEGRSLLGIAEQAGLELNQVRGLLQRGKARVIAGATHRLRTATVPGR